MGQLGRGFQNRSAWDVVLFLDGTMMGEIRPGVSSVAGTWCCKGWDVANVWCKGWGGRQRVGSGAWRSKAGVVANVWCPVPASLLAHPGLPPCAQRCVLPVTGPHPPAYCIVLAAVKGGVGDSRKRFARYECVQEVCNYQNSWDLKKLRRLRVHSLL